MPQKHYTPPLSRFLVCALYHEAKQRRIPMRVDSRENLTEGGGGFRMVDAWPALPSSACFIKHEFEFLFKLLFELQGI